MLLEISVSLVFPPLYHPVYNYLLPFSLQSLQMPFINLVLPLSLSPQFNNIRKTNTICIIIYGITNMTQINLYETESWTQRTERWLPWERVGSNGIGGWG